MAQARFTGSVVTAADRRRGRETLVTFFVLVGTLLGIIGLIALYLWLSWQRLYWADRVTDARAQLAEAAQTQQFLEAQVATTFSLEQLIRFARNQGMVEPELHYWPPEP